MFKGACLAGVAFHLVLILIVSCRDTFTVLSQGNTILPSSLDSRWEKSANVTTTFLGQSTAEEQSGASTFGRLPRYYWNRG